MAIDGDSAEKLLADLIDHREGETVHAFGLANLTGIK
jgi:hypothetical protein